MAQEFPSARVVGVDLVPVPHEIPYNCRFEVDDINLGLSHFSGQFDLVHARCVATGVSYHLNSILRV